MKNVKNQQNLTFGSEYSDISEASIEESRNIKVWAKKLEDKEYGWRSIHKQKQDIQKIKKQLYELYVHHRKHLCETVKQFCIQSNNDSFNFAALMRDQNERYKNEIITNQLKTSNCQQKIALVQRIITERRIKRYYKNKHEINDLYQLDHEDDQIQIYKIYEDAFMKNKDVGAIDEEYLKRQPTILQPYEQSNIQIKGVPSMIEMSVRNSFQPLPSEPMLSPKQKINYLRGTDPFGGFSPDLSFQQRNDHNMGIHNNILDSFAINPVDKYDAISEGGRQKSKMQKEDDQLSHKDNIYKNFIEKQNEELQKQRMRVQYLTDKAFKVLNNGEIQDEDQKVEQESYQEDKLAQFRYLLGQIIQTYSVCQHLKFLLKFKSYEILNKLYQHASEYFGEQIEFEEPIKATHMFQIVQSTMPQADQSGIKIIMYNLFQDKQQISYDNFLDRLTPNINELQYKIMQQSSIASHNHKSLDLTIRLFSVWIELDYFEKEIKNLLDQSPNIIEKFVKEVAENSILSTSKICDFIFKSKKNKVKKLKTEIFFRHITGYKLNLSEFYRWINTRKVQQVPYIKKEKEIIEHKNQYYYNLY